MRKATEELRASGIMDRVFEAGSKANPDRAALDDIASVILRCLDR